MLYGASLRSGVTNSDMAAAIAAALRMETADSGPPRNYMSVAEAFSNRKGFAI